MNQAPVDQAAVPSTPKKPALWRRIVVPLCVVLGCILTALSVAATWVKLTALDTDTYVATVAPLVKDEDVSLAVATRVTDKVFAEVDVAKVVDEVLPDRAKALAPALVGVVERYAVQLVDGIIRSDQFETLWTEANRVAHTQIVRLLTGKLVSDETRGRAQEVVLNLQGVVEQVDTRLQERGIDLFPDRAPGEQAGQFVVARQSQLEDIRQLVTFLDNFAFVLPILALLFFLVAIWLSPRRPRTIMWIGLGTAITFAIIAIVVRYLRRRFVDGIEDPLTRSAADSIWSQVLSGLRTQVVVAIVLALIVALAGWLLGGSRAATSGRSAIRQTIGRFRGEDTGEPPSAFARFVSRFRRPIQMLAVGVAILVLLVASKVTLGLVLLATLIVIVVLVLVELIAGPPRADDEALEPPAPADQLPPP